MHGPNLLLASCGCCCHEVVLRGYCHNSQGVVLAVGVRESSEICEVDRTSVVFVSATWTKRYTPYGMVETSLYAANYQMDTCPKHRVPGPREFRVLSPQSPHSLRLEKTLRMESTKSLYSCTPERLGVWTVK